MTYDCTHSLKAKELDSTVSINRGINWDWANFKSEQAADDFYQYMSYNHNSGAILTEHNGTYEVRWR